MPARVAMLKWGWFIEVFRWRGARHNFDNMLNRTSGDSSIALVPLGCTLHTSTQLVLRIYSLMTADLSQQCATMWLLRIYNKFHFFRTAVLATHPQRFTLLNYFMQLFVQAPIKSLHMPLKVIYSEHCRVC